MILWYQMKMEYLYEFTHFQRFSQWVYLPKVSLSKGKVCLPTIFFSGPMLNFGGVYILQYIKKISLVETMLKPSFQLFKMILPFNYFKPETKNQTTLPPFSSQRKQQTKHTKPSLTVTQIQQRSRFFETKKHGETSETQSGFAIITWNNPKK